MDLTIHLKTTSEEIKTWILKSIQTKLLGSFRDLHIRFIELFQLSILDMMHNSAIYKAFANPTPEGLVANLGLSNPVADLDSLIDIMVQSVVVEIIPPTLANGRIHGSITACAIPENYEDLLNSPHSSYISVNKKGISTPIHWLEWLLKMGDMTITDYHIQYGQDFTSRTKLAIMEKSGMWKMPSEFSGTIGDNFITKEIERYYGKLNQGIKQIIQQTITK
jgi:hypothetical protein